MANPFRAAARLTAPVRGMPRRASTWSGGEGGRLYSDWDAWTVSPEMETRFNFRLLRARARSFARNNPWIVGFLDELANNVVGANGIMLQAMIRTALDKPAKATNDEIERGWKEWRYPENASADGHDSFTEIERQVIDTIAVDGECFVRRLRGFPNVRLRAADRRRRPRRRDVQRRRWPESESDPHGRRSRPLESRGRLPRLDALRRGHGRHRAETRAGARRGDASPVRPVASREHRARHHVVRANPRPMRHMSEYELNHVVSSRAAAAKTAVIINKSDKALDMWEGPKKGEEPRMFELEAGVIPELLPGQEIQTFDPTFPTANYGDFVTAVLRGVARGLKVSYLTLTGDLRQANYSSMRAGLLPERDHWRSLQVWFATHFHRVTYRDWVDMAALKRAIAVDARLGSDYYDVAWRGRGWKWVDPKNELEAFEKEVQLGLNSRKRGAAEQGNDYEEIVDERAEEEAYADDAGVDVSLVSPATKALPPGARTSRRTPTHPRPTIRATPLTPTSPGPALVAWRP
jgi:capsid protein